MLIVGLGASAGGIQAVKRFFEHVPADSGVAYVVILHLSPDHESRLAEVLQVSTALPVTQVQGRVRVEPNHVYVIPPHQSLAMSGDELVLSDMSRVEERRAPVDIFFRTLADSHGARAVCVILSGTGADGSMGMKRVKEQGGICLVQDPDEAEHGDMPRNAIATALVDDVLPVERIPAKILAYRENWRTLQLPEEPPTPAESDEAALREIFSQLRTRTGHDFSNYKRATVLRRIARRMGIREVSTLPAYARYVAEHPDETQGLLKDLLISVTNFFRDSAAFEALEQRVIPALFAGKGENDQVRAWVAGCATGEEAYSIAMLLAERAGTPGSPSVQVFATDIDEAALAAAREGCYTINDAADVPPERLERFFTKEGASYRVRKELRELILFARHNVIKDPPFSHLDLVSCRNLLIYLNRMAQQRCMEVMHFALNAGGILFLGSSESADVSPDLFAPFDAEARVFARRAVSSRMALPAGEVSLPMRRERSAPGDDPRDLAAPAQPSSAELHHRLLEQYAPPSIVINEAHDIVHLSARAGRYLKYTGGDPSHNLLNAVRPELRHELRAALHEAAQQRTSVEARGVAVRIGQHTAVVDLLVRPVLPEDGLRPGLFLVLFEELEGAALRAASAAVPITPGDAARQLEEELRNTRGQLRTTTERHEMQAEELKASNQELQSMNEELRSSTEELETGKEELQSLNEELRTVNEELKANVEQQVQANDDIQNLINSAEIGTIFLDPSSRIKLFTPKARDIFNLIPADRGRPLSDISSLLVDTDLTGDVALVLESLQRVEREVQARDGRWHLMRAVPYRTADNRIDGVVLTFVDITERKRAADELIAVKETLASELKSMTLLHELSTRLLEAGALPSLLDEVLRAATTIQDAEFGSIQLTDEQTGELRTVAQLGFSRSFSLAEHDQDEWNPGGNLALQRGERVVVEDTETDPEYAPFRKAAALAGYRSVQHTPLYSRRGEPLGVLSTYMREPRRSTERELRLMDLYARQAAEVIGTTRAQEALRESEERLRRALEVESVGVFFFNADGTISYANDAFLRMSGYTREEFDAGQLRNPATAPEWVDGTVGALEQFEATGRIAAHEREYVRTDGGRGWGVFAASRLNQHEGVAFLIDLSDAKRAQEQLWQSEARLRLIADSVLDYAIFTLDVMGRIDSWNPGAARMFRFSEEDAIGQPGDILFTAEHRDRGTPQEELRQARELGRAIDDRWHVRKDGSHFFASGITAPLYNSQQVLIGYVKIARDLTERKRWEDELKRAHGELEQRVAERTAALAQANLALDLELRERRQAEERARSLVGRLITVQEDERRRIARDLHDHLGQQVAGLSLKLDAVEQSFHSESARRAAIAEAQNVITKLDRDLDFFTWELRPAALDDIGLVVTLGNYVREWSRNFGIPAEFHSAGLDNVRLAHEIETNLYRIAQEALNNTHKHANAGRVGVILERRDGTVVLIIEDDGGGLAHTGRRSDGYDSGIGIVGMQERAALVGGTLDIETAPDEGTTVFVRVPAVLVQPDTLAG